MNTWSDNFASPGYDLAGVGAIDQVWAAILERLDAMASVPNSGLSTSVTPTGSYAASMRAYLPGGPVAGTDVQAQVFWQWMYNGVNALFSGAGESAWLPSLSAMVGAAGTLPSIGTDPDLTAVGWTFASLRTSLGYDPAGWRRRCPREINTIHDATDTQGNAVADGQRAWLIGSGASKLDLYQYSGAMGQWLYCGQAGGLGPDVLDSTSAAPNYVAPGSYAPSSLACQIGDYLDGINLVEIRDVVRSLKIIASVWPYAGSTNGLEGPATSRRAGGSPVSAYGGDSTWAMAQSDAAASFAAATATTAGGFYPGYYTYGWQVFGGPPATYGYQAVIYKASTTPIDPFGGTQQRAISVFACCADPSVGVGGSPANATFDANGFAWCANRTYGLVGTAAPAGPGGSPITVADTANTPLPDWVAEPAVPGNFYQGFQVINVIVAADFGVTGGFQYT